MSERGHGVEFSLTSSAFQDDPWTTFAALRDGCPVHHTTTPGPHYTVSREADVRAALRDDETWSSRWGPGLASTDPDRAVTVLVSSDPPEHTAERLAISRVFKPSAIEAMGPDIRRLVDRTIDGFVARGRGDLIGDFAMPIPLTVMCWMLGTPVADIERFRGWVLPMAEGVSSPDGRLEPAVADAFRAFLDYFGRHVDARAAAVAAGDDVPDDLLTRLLTVERDGRRLDRMQVLGFCQFLLVAGSATTTLLIGNVVHRLLEHPDQMALVRADRSLVPAAIEESLRFDSPVHGLFRTATCPATIDGVDIPEASKLLILFGSANRDPAAWADPERFDVRRDLAALKRNYAFGYGIHYCLGAPLARLEGTIALAAVLDRLPDLRRDGEPEGVRAGVLHGFERYPIAWG